MAWVLPNRSNIEQTGPASGYIRINTTEITLESQPVWLALYSLGLS